MNVGSILTALLPDVPWGAALAMVAVVVALPMVLKYSFMHRALGKVSAGSMQELADLVRALGGQPKAQESTVAGGDPPTVEPPTDADPAPPSRLGVTDPANRLRR